LAQLVAQGKVAIAGGVYNVETGDIDLVVNPF
jgi:carbonic anhydrase